MRKVMSYLFFILLILLKKFGHVRANGERIDFKKNVASGEELERVWKNDTTPVGKDYCHCALEGCACCDEYEKKKICLRFDTMPHDQAVKLSLQIDNAIVSTHMVSGNNIPQFSFNIDRQLQNHFLIFRMYDMNVEVLRNELTTSVKLLIRVGDVPKYVSNLGTHVIYFPKGCDIFTDYKFKYTRKERRPPKVRKVKRPGRHRSAVTAPYKGRTAPRLVIKGVTATIPRPAYHYAVSVPAFPHRGLSNIINIIIPGLGIGGGYCVPGIVPPAPAPAPPPPPPPAPPLACVPIPPPIKELIEESSEEESIEEVEESPEQPTTEQKIPSTKKPKKKKKKKKKKTTTERPTQRTTQRTTKRKLPRRTMTIPWPVHPPKRPGMCVTDSENYCLTSTESHVWMGIIKGRPRRY